jgi:transcriptional regulator with XRE-family HTH domain
MDDDILHKRKERLRIDLRDRAYREQYATSTLVDNVSAQVQALRRQRGLSQEELATRLGTKQPRVSYVEAPPDKGKLPNWEIDTLNRIAQALGTRLKVTFETYGSLVGELDTITSDSLRRPDLADDSVLFLHPPIPTPDPDAPERTRWMQELMIAWLWDEKLDLTRLASWLQGRGLPPVGPEEEPYHWLLRGLSVPGGTQQFLEKRFAERLAILLGEQPDVEPIVPDGQEDFLSNLYWTCAGLNQPGFLAEQLWLAYKRLRFTKPSGAVRDSLQAALVQNQFGETRPLKEIWEPMVTRGRHRWLRGNEIVGFEGILIRHRTLKHDLQTVFWALGRISQRWDAGTPEQQKEFKRLMGKLPDLVQPGAVNALIEYARGPGSDWTSWAQALLPLPVVAKGDTSNTVSLEVRSGGVEFSAIWSFGNSPRTEIHQPGYPTLHLVEETSYPGQPRLPLLANEFLTRLGNTTEETPDLKVEALLAHAVVWKYVQEVRYQTMFRLDR